MAWNWTRFSSTNETQVRRGAQARAAVTTTVDFVFCTPDYFLEFLIAFSCISPRPHSILSAQQPSKNQDQLYLLLSMDKKCWGFQNEFIITHFLKSKHSLPCIHCMFLCVYGLKTIVGWTIHSKFFKSVFHFLPQFKSWKTTGNETADKEFYLKTIFNGFSG